MLFNIAIRKQHDDGKTLKKRKGKERTLHISHEVFTLLHVTLSMHSASASTDSLPGPSALENSGSGYCEAFLGPMFSGKTDLLLRALDRYSRLHGSGVETVLIKPLADTRGHDAEIETHSGCRRICDGRVSSGEALWDVLMKRAHISSSPIFVVAIDEAQFLKNLLYFVERVLNHWDTEVYGRMAYKTVIVYMAALDGTYERKPWPEIAAVLPLCHTFRKLTSICSCCARREAPFSRRDVDSDQLIVPGAEEIYSAVCSRCYLHSGKQCCNGGGGDDNEKK